MNKKIARLLATGLLLLSLDIIITACSNRRQSNNQNDPSRHSVALIIDNTGVNDHSFNQAAWQGLQTYGNQHDLEQGHDGYQYFSAKNALAFPATFNQAVKANYQTIFGVGYQLKEALLATAKRYPYKNFVLIDAKVKPQKNVASVNFKSEQAAYLAGLVAAQETKTKTVGFIGGAPSQTVDQFKQGFAHGVKNQAQQMHRHITLLQQEVGDFNNTQRANSLAQTMYLKKKADIIFQAAGGAGTGVFQAAKTINETRPAKDKIWVIGVDTDQSTLGNYEAKGGQESNFVLTSVITGVNLAVKNVANRTYQGHFPAGRNLVYDLSNNGVALTRGQIDTTAWRTAQIAKKRILSGKIKISTHQLTN